MLLTITYEGENTQDLGFLLHKNPHRAQQFELSCGKAYVFYPELGDNRTTAALLLDLDPIVLARGKLGSKDGGLFDYVNDRPYTSSSFMSTAISRIFGTAMSGRCDKRQELADTELMLTARVYELRDGGNETLAQEIFEPLGYEVTTERGVLDEKYPEWGMSPYITLTLKGRVRLCDLLNHLYVLIPAFDKQKHYYINENEIQKLLDHGEGWLAAHPAREKIVSRCLGARRSYVRKAVDILLGNDSEDAEDAADIITDRKTATLNERRLEAVKTAVLNSGASSVIDLGCGECRLTARLLDEKQINRVTACDVSVKELEKAAKKLHMDRMPEIRKNKLTLMQASLTYKDERFGGYDCACIVEVIEHIEPMRIPAFERTVFEFAAPRTVIVTTPNREYNANYTALRDGELRHADHRFEWTRAEFEAWTRHICEKFGYSCEISGIGDRDEKLGSPTQMAVFSADGK